MFSCQWENFSEEPNFFFININFVYIFQVEKQHLFSDIYIYIYMCVCVCVCVCVCYNSLADFSHARIPIEMAKMYSNLKKIV